MSEKTLTSIFAGNANEQGAPIKYAAECIGAKCWRYHDACPSDEKFALDLTSVTVGHHVNEIPDTCMYVSFRADFPNHREKT